MIKVDWKNKKTWNIEDMANYLGKSPATIKSYMSRKRHVLPPCINGMRATWVSDVAIDFFKERSLENTRSIHRRPRKTTV